MKLPHPQWPRVFVLLRDRDGTGEAIVAWGTRYPDGYVTVRWEGQHVSTAVWADMNTMLAVSNKNGDTRVRWSPEPIPWPENPFPSAEQPW